MSKSKKELKKREELSLTVKRRRILDEKYPIPSCFNYYGCYDNTPITAKRDAMLTHLIAEGKKLEEAIADSKRFVERIKIDEIIVEEGRGQITDKVWNKITSNFSGLA